ncbi:MAG: elongation factor P maturation arginine rhamnosyltransferase EarP [Rubrivivax sp.]|nr:elongation factor P maturation arginine rhamnosyltransferase EarP [Rubrivivax sp.]
MLSPRTVPMLWDLYCRVVDNHGDVGVCWRLATALAALGQQVRLIIDDASALAWMAPHGQPGVTVLPWAAPPVTGDVVVEAFGCDLPTAAVEQLHKTVQRQQPAPVWINLEHLSAEPYVERSHGLPSPQPGGLVKWFFYPGFTARTGGLLREADLLTAQSRFDRMAWLAGRHITLLPAERVVSLFCYDNPRLAELIQALAEVPTLLLVAPGPAQQRVAALPRARSTEALPPRRSTAALPKHVRTVALPWLTQQDFDHLLWAADINFVRGEDSLVRGLWAGKPLVWQAYAQQDGAHHRKVQALIEQFAPAALPAAVQALWRGWNGAPGVAIDLQTLAPGEVSSDWSAAAQSLRNRLLLQPDLASQLLRFVMAKRVA